MIQYRARCEHLCVTSCARIYSPINTYLPCVGVHAVLAASVYAARAALAAEDVKLTKQQCE